MVEPTFYRNWKAPTKKEIKDRYPDSDPDLVRLTTALASHQIMMEDPLDYIDLNKTNYEGLEDFLPVLEQMEGGPYEKGLRFSKYYKEKINHYNYYKQSNPAFAKGMLDEAIKELTEGPGNGPKKENKRRDAPWMSGHFSSDWQYYPPSEKIVEELAKFDLLQKYVAHKSPERKQGKPVEDYDIRVARSVADLRFISRLDMALPKALFWEKYQRGQLLCKIPTTTVQQTLEIVVLLDDSGSMNDEYKVQWVVGILNVLFDAVIAGQAIVYFACFAYDRSAFVKIDSEAQVEKFKEDFSAGCHGTTYLDRILPELADDLKNGELDGFTLSNVMDILIINDGQDDIPKDLILGIPCHAISVEKENKDLKQMCNNNGGNYYQASESGDIQLLWLFSRRHPTWEDAPWLQTKEWSLVFNAHTTERKASRN